MGMPAGALVRVLGRITDAGGPVSVLDESGDPAYRPVASTASSALLVSIANSRESGRRMARFLVGLGHRHIAFISPFHAALWSQNRQTGMDEACAEAGVGARLHPFVYEGPGEAAEYAVAAMRIGAMVRAMSHAASTGPAGTRFERVRNAVTSLEKRLDELQREAYRDRLAALCIQALSCKEITAWVCANDSAAVEALAVLKEHAVKVPGSISVAGFDDSLDAFFTRLTSYNFNTPAAIRTMLDHITNPSQRNHPRKNRQPIDIEGFISRWSTASAARTM